MLRLKKISLTPLIVGTLAFLSVVLGFLTFSQPKTPEIKFVSPKDKETGIELSPLIKVIFKQKLSPENQKLISLETNPSFSVITNWQEANVLLVTPAETLMPQTLYQIKVFYKGKPIFSWSFSTQPSLETKPPEVTPQEQTKNQGRGDIEFDKVFSDLYEKKPWLKKLPLTSENYVIVYDFEKKAIRVRLILNANSSLSREEQISQIKNEVRNRLQKIGVDLTTEEIYYTFLP